MACRITMEEEMTMPGFAAEASLYGTSLLYTAIGSFGWRGGGIRPQFLYESPHHPGPYGGGQSFWGCNSDCLKSCYTLGGTGPDCINRCCGYGL
jgi:hypothetical protein